jgi:hypothetical protein
MASVRAGSSRGAGPFLPVAEIRESKRKDLKSSPSEDVFGSTEIPSPITSEIKGKVADR